MALANSGLKRLLSSVSCNTSKVPIWRLGAQRLYSNSSADTVAKTYQKFFNLPEGGKISRHTFVAHGQKLKAAIEKVDRYEAFFVQAAAIQIGEAHGFSKFPEEGGKEYTPQELVKVLRGIPKDTIVYVATIFSRALFRAMDTNGDGYISREEWAVHLKLRGTYKSDKQATQAFDDIDQNKDGKLSMQEFEDITVKFWTSAGSNEDTANMYGTQY